MIDSTVAGVAFLAGIKAGLWNKKEIAQLQSVDKLFTSKMPKAQARGFYQGWQKAIAQAQLT